MDNKDKKDRMSYSRAVLAAVFFILMLIPSFAIAGPGININVKSVLASANGNSIDPRLKSMASELQFRYSSYKLLGEKSLRLSVNNSGSVSFPGGNMNLTVKGIEGNRAVIDIEIIKGGSRMLQTSVKLLNNKKITIGGPSHKDGTLIFNISASF